MSKKVPTQSKQLSSLSLRGNLVKGVTFTLLAFLLLIGVVYTSRWYKISQLTKLPLEGTSIPTPKLTSEPLPSEQLGTLSRNTGISGHYIFYDGEDTNQFISLNLNNGQYEKLPLIKEEGVDSAIISPDKNKIAYFPGSGRLAVLDLVTEQVKHYALPEFPRGKIIWSPDSKSVAYVGIGRSICVFGGLPVPAPRTVKTLYKLNISDGKSEVLYTLSPEFAEGYCGLVSWLSHNEIVFMSGSGPQFLSANFAGNLSGEGLYLLDLAVGRIETLSSEFIYNISVNLNQRLIAYTTCNFEADPLEENLKVLDINSRNLVAKRTYVREMSPVDVFSGTYLVWSSDGKFLFFSRTDFSKMKHQYDTSWDSVEKLNLSNGETEILFSDSGGHAPVAEVDSVNLLVHHSGYAPIGKKTGDHSVFYLYDLQARKKTYYPHYGDWVTPNWASIIGFISKK